jgi:hypothetical protein
MELENIIWIVALVIFIALMVWACIFAFNKGKSSGNVTVSLVLMAFWFSGFMMIVGLFHLAGTSKHVRGMGFDKVWQEKRNLKNRKLEAEYFSIMADLEEVEPPQKHLPPKPKQTKIDA